MYAEADMVVQLSDRLFEEARQRAVDAGFPSVDDFVADIVEHELHDEPENIDHLFTPECMRLVDESTAQIKAGKSHTSEQVREHFDRKLAAWHESNGH
jgi:hypothetical protein